MERRILADLASLIAEQKGRDGDKEGTDKDLIEAFQQRHPHPRYAKLNASTITRWKEILSKRGVLVESCDFNALFRGEARASDSRSLQTRFELKECLVIRQIKKEPFEGEAELLLALGNHAADEVRNRAQFENLRHLAIGSGRTLVRYAESLMNRAPIAHDLTVSPISGRVWLGDLWNLYDQPESPGELESPLDADFAAMYIARGLHQYRRRNIRVSQIAHFAFTSLPEETKDTIVGRCAFKMDRGWNWNLETPGRVVFGVASLSNGAHPVMRFIAKFKDARKLSPEAKPIIEFGQMLQSAQGYARQNVLPGVGEASLRNFVILPLPKERSDFNTALETYSNLANTIEQLNRHIISISFQHFRDICAAGGFSQLIGGGPSKLQLLWTMLLPNLFSMEAPTLVNSLCTDLDSSRQLVDAASQLQQDPNLREWYRKAISIVLR